MVVQEIGETLVSAAAGAGGLWVLMKRLSRSDKTADSAADAVVTANGAVERLIITLREEVERLTGVNLALIQQLNDFQHENAQLKIDVLQLTERLKDFSERNANLAADAGALSKQVAGLHDMLKSIG